MISLDKILILAASSMSLLICNILNYTGGILHPALIQAFNANNEEQHTIVSLIGSLNMSQLFLVGPIASIVIIRFSCRVSAIIGAICISAGLCLAFFAKSLAALFLTYGLLTGFGVGMVYTAGYVVVGEHFNKNRHLAFCVLSFVAGGGILAGGPLVQFLISTFGVHGAFLILGGLTLNILPNAFVMHSKKKRVKLPKYGKSTSKPPNLEEPLYHSDKEKDETIDGKVRLIDMFKDTPFWPLIFQIALWHISLSIFYYHLQTFSLNDGVSEYHSALLLTMSGAANILNRLLTGLVLNKTKVSPFLLNIGSTAIAGVTILLAPLYSQTYIGKSMLSILSGMFIGSLTALIAPVCVDAFSIQRMSSAIGALHFSAGIGIVIGPPLGEVIVGEEKVYARMFIVAGILFIVAGLLTLLATCLKNHVKGLTGKPVVVDYKTVEGHVLLNTEYK